MVESAQPLLKKWEEFIEAHGGITADVKVDEDLRELSADVISRACFGSSYSKGKQIFSKLRSLQQTFSNQNILFGTTNFGCALLFLMKFIYSMMTSAIVPTQENKLLPLLCIFTCAMLKQILTSEEEKQDQQSGERGRVTDLGGSERASTRMSRDKFIRKRFNAVTA